LSAVLENDDGHHTLNAMAVPQSTQRLTEAEYLALERAAVDVKSEFYDGEIFAMSGGTRWHSCIATNMAIELGKKLEGHRCRPYNTDLRVKVETSRLYTYPDLSVVYGEPQFVDAKMDTLTNPTLIVEVLSDSTEAYDRGRKFEHYRRISSLREYLLINQDEPRIEQFIQRDGEWLLRDAIGLDATLEMPSIGVSISLSAVFKDVVFPPKPTPEPDQGRI